MSIEKRKDWGGIEHGRGEGPIATGDFVGRKKKTYSRRLKGKEGRNETYLSFMKGIRGGTRNDRS